MPSVVWVPAQAKTFLLMTMKLHLRINLASRYKGMFSPIEDQDSAIRAHRRYDIWVLRLIAGFIHLMGMIDLLYNAELNLVVNHFLARAASITPYLFSVLVIVNDIW